MNSRSIHHLCPKIYQQLVRSLSVSACHQIIPRSLATRFNIPQKYNFARDVVDKWAEDSKVRNCLALWHVSTNGQENKLTFEELHLESQKLASALSSLGHMKHIMVILPKVVPWWILNVAVARMGSVILPATIQLSSKDIAYRLIASNVDCIVADVESAAKVDEAMKNNKMDLKYKILVGEDQKAKRHGWLNYHTLLSSGASTFPCADTNSDDNFQIYFTSGTTGNPKMVPRTHINNCIGIEYASKYWYNLKESEVVWAISDPGWAKATYGCLHGPWCAGATVFVHENPRFESKWILKTLCDYPIKTFCAPPTLYRSLIQEDLSKYTFKSLDHCTSAGEPLNPEVTEQWKKATGMEIKEGYGQTETSLLIGMFNGMIVKPGSMGKSISEHVDIQLLDGDFKPVPTGSEGAIAVRLSNTNPAYVFKGYINPGMDQTSFKNGYYFTGDRAYKDNDGFFWFVGRNDDVINSAGYRIGPFEVESALLEHPAVAESAVVSSPDPERGEVVKAFIILAPTFKNKGNAQLAIDIQNHCKTTTAPYKYPRKIEFVESLPKTVSGKIKRKELRDKEWTNAK